MATFLFDKIIFGPVKSRRLGVSLGVNLLPTDSKVCSFDCIYCECGWTPRKREHKAELPSRQQVAQRLEAQLKKMQQAGELPDVITFAGNGEPTLHPDFAAIIDDTISLRNSYAPNCRVAVLSNATMLHREPVFQALLKVDDNILKLDSAIERTVELLDCPMGRFNLAEVMEQLARFGKSATIQTLFVRGKHKGERIDNTSPEELEAWLTALKKINPAQVMIYTIARDTPAQGLVKIPLDELNQIADRVKAAGFEVQVSA
ncbi:wyosine [tRNA(Phe)-imidazoG37] synthetase (radical SAM superfamily) [Mangrovibacterium marinum]|uniref:Wyosine [tRNA(Phe)-imidazoG37] synthetase (Radical SAM superfamily) n=1 Tax=Mangrovibacterium marinum TaxID=1639118 RepID=A0A2T5C2V6_9BACT|nr:radical SAM protein [Mangrovibacterium marinum]PTN09022.1 wyosine [tRNA(Phe)-imidazoG37] synthetase (radical SAM superfamily) [Mangrovibacterium marinum]